MNQEHGLCEHGMYCKQRPCTSPINPNTLLPSFTVTKMLPYVSERQMTDLLLQRCTPQRQRAVNVQIEGTCFVLLQ